jgi:folate-binding protein YgfZ
MHSGWRLVSDLGLGVLRARGAQACTFLQGQLSNDTSSVRSGQLQLSGYHTPQGRAIALLRLTALAADDLLAILPLELVPVVVARLSRFVLRAKVRITDDSAQWQILGFRGELPRLPASALSLPYGGARQLVLIQKTDPAALEVGETGSRDDWVAADIAAGLPQVFLATSEAFVAQMLNLDLLGGIALDKGCYTGQEIIARAHYRGQVKRRMQHFVSELPCALSPGQSGMLADGRSFKVVAAVPLAAGRCEFLAVAPAAPGADEPEAASGTQPIAVQQLPLPYELPFARP